MNEKRLLNCMMIEGIMLVILSLCLLILPKLTMISYGVMLAGVLISYGIYKLIHSFANKQFGVGRIFYILVGIYLLTVGILILFVPKINLFWLIALLGIYYIVESISAVVYAIKLRTAYHLWGCKLFTAIVMFIIGLIIILGLPTVSFWIVTVLSGIGLLVKGMTKLTISLGNLCNYNI